MLDEQTMNHIKEKLVAAFAALHSVLGDQIEDEIVVAVARPLIRHLIRAELGREPADDEMHAVLDRLQVMFLKGGEQ